MWGSSGEEDWNTAEANQTFERRDHDKIDVRSSQLRLPKIENGMLALKLLPYEPISMCNKASR